MDSTANVFEAVLTGSVRLALTVDYGQRAARAEIEAASKIAHELDVQHEVIQIPWLGRLGGSVLTGAGPIPEFQEERLDDRVSTEASAKAVWVPNRNGVLLNIAAAYAERLAADRVIVGFNREEAATFPDNSEAYLNAATGALAYSTANRVQISCFTTHLDKTEIICRIGTLEREHGRPFPWKHVWSCYQAGPIPCGVCESCQRLARARKKAGII